jgi:hypothetical protein
MVLMASITRWREATSPADEPVAAVNGSVEPVENGLRRVRVQDELQSRAVRVGVIGGDAEALSRLVVDHMEGPVVGLVDEIDHSPERQDRPVAEVECHRLLGAHAEGELDCHWPQSRPRAPLVVFSQELHQVAADEHLVASPVERLSGQAPRLDVGKGLLGDLRQQGLVVASPPAMGLPQPCSGHESLEDGMHQGAAAEGIEADPGLGRLEWIDAEDVTHEVGVGAPGPGLERCGRCGCGVYGGHEIRGDVSVEAAEARGRTGPHGLDRSREAGITERRVVVAPRSGLDQGLEIVLLDGGGESGVEKPSGERRDLAIPVGVGVALHVVEPPARCPLGGGAQISPGTQEVQAAVGRDGSRRSEQMAPVELQPVALERELTFDQGSFTVGQEAVVGWSARVGPFGHAQDPDPVEGEPGDGPGPPDEHAVAEASSSSEAALELQLEGSGEDLGGARVVEGVEAGEALEDPVDAVGGGHLLLGPVAEISEVPAERPATP